jgi:iron complex outermembrane recepter protein
MGFTSRKLAYGVLTAVSAILAQAASAAVMAADEETAATAEEGGALQEIVVSARRREESIQSTPVSVSIVGVVDLESKAAVNLGDLQGSIPNLLITNQNSGAAAANLSIRGLTFADIEKSFDPTVAVVVDGVFLGTSTGQFLDFFDIAKIEVLRGPQGTLFGRNTIGGVINITRTEPTGELGGKLEVSYGRFNTFTGRGVFNTPITDILAAKFFYFDDHSNGWYHDGNTGRPRGESHNQNFGVALRLAPKEADFTALLTLEEQVQTYDPVISNLAATGDVFAAVEQPSILNRNTGKDLYTIYSLPAQGTFHQPAATLQVNFTAGPVKVTSVTGYRKQTEDQTQDFDGASEALLPFAYAAGLSPLYYTHRIQTFHQFSQELRAAGKIFEPLDYVVGAYYYDSAYELTQYTRIFGSPYGLPQVVSGTSKSVAGFADFDWQLASQWRLNFGGRYTQDKKSLLNYDPDFLGNPHATFSKFTPKVGLDWRPTSDLMFYTSYSVGYRSGGYSNRAATADSTNRAFQPETVDSIEVGAKSEWFEHKLSANLAWFHAKYKDMQQNTTIPGGPTGNQTIVSNVGSAIIRGVELELSLRPIEPLTLNASLGTISSHFNGFITQAPLPGSTDPTKLADFDYSNNDLIYNPSYTLTFGADYRVPVTYGTVITHLGYRHIAAYDQQISSAGVVNTGTLGPNGVPLYEVLGNDPRVRADAQNIVDASFTNEFKLGSGKAKITLYGRNLTNDLGPTHGFTVAGLWAFGTAREPRTYGVALGYEF